MAKRKQKRTRKGHKARRSHNRALQQRFVMLLGRAAPKLARVYVAPFVSRLFQAGYSQTYVGSDGKILKKKLLADFALCIRETLARELKLSEKEEARARFLKTPSRERAATYGFDAASVENLVKREKAIYGQTFHAPASALSTGLPGNEETDPFEYWFKRENWLARSTN